MKTLTLPITCLWVWATLVPLQAIPLRAFLGGSPSAVVPATYLRNQNFETPTTGYDNTETWVTSTGTPSPAYTTTVLLGTQSLACNATAGGVRVRSDFTNQNEAWGYFLFQMGGSAPGGDRQIFSLAANGSGTEAYKFLLTSTRKIRLTTSGSYYTTDALTIGTKYHCWWRCKNGTGTAELEFSFKDASVDAVKPTSGNAYILASGLTLTSQIGRIYLGCDQSCTASPFIFDKVLIDDVAIGDNP